MKKRKLGNSNDEVAVVGLGCMGMSDFYGPAEDERSIEVLHRALEIGVTFLDTADMYGTGKNEQLVARALKGRRERAFIATKFAIVRGADGSRSINGKPEYVQQACEASLARLGIEQIDLYYQHRVDRSVPIEETVGAMAKLVEQGKVRHLGLSECAPQTLRRAHAVHPIAALQSEYSLWSRDPEQELLATCEELGVTFVAYSPLGRGFLTGAIRSLDDLAKDDWRRALPRFKPENFAKNLELVAKLEQLAQARGVTAGQLALAWVLSRSPRTVTIPGTRSIARLEENAQAAELTLSAREIADIEEVFPQRVAAGERYPAEGLASVNG
jgi:aryl-alcohol dehydrogenase-like predicted oxidoreductase